MKAPMRILCSSLAFGSLLALSSLALADDTKNFHWNGQLSADQTVTVKTINGDVDASPASGNQVEVTAEASGQSAQDVRFEARPDSNGVTICEIYPGVDSCSGSSTGHHNNNHLRIHYTVHVPAAMLGEYDRLIDLLREEESVTRQMYVDLDRLVSAYVVNDGE